MPSNPFPEFGDQPNLPMQYAYVEHVMCELAEAGKLYLTELLTREEPIRTRVAEICMGVRVEDGNQTQGHDLPDALADYRVRLKSIPHIVHDDIDNEDGTTTARQVVKAAPISFRYGSRRKTDGMTYEAARQHYKTWRKGGELEMVTIETGKTEIDLPLKKACACLAHQGKHVRYAKSKRHEKLYWKVEEVRPGAEPKKKRGRPKKIKAVEETPGVASAE